MVRRSEHNTNTGPEPPKGTDSILPESFRLPLAFCLALLVPAASADDVLLDQFGEPGGLGVEQGRVQLAIVVTAKRLRRLKAWERALRKDFADLPILRVADVPRTAPTAYDEVAAKLRKRLPEDVAVLVDLEGTWAARYELDVSVPNLLLFAPDGSVQARHAGMYKASLYAPLREDIAALLTQRP